MPNTTWFITGATAGIGRATVSQLLKRGDRVWATARRPAPLDDLAAAYPQQLRTSALDVTDTAALRADVDRAFAEFGRIHVIFANAGRGAFGAAEELSDASVEGQIALNMTAPIQLTRAALPHLRAQGGGRIIYTSSMGGQINTPGGSMYHASKWGAEGFFESVIAELQPLGIGITIVEPGNVRTGFGSALEIADPISAYATTPVGQVRQIIEQAGGNLTADALGNPEKIAAAVIDSATQEPAPRRLALGSDAYDAIRGALQGRLAELETAKDLAHSTDFN
nr:SDR family oxidoreductase [Streptomyces sp. NBC_00830]